MPYLYRILLYCYLLKYIHLVPPEGFASGINSVGHYSHRPKQSPCIAGQEHTLGVYNPKPIDLWEYKILSQSKSVFLFFEQIKYKVLFYVFLRDEQV